MEAVALLATNQLGKTTLAMKLVKQNKEKGVVVVPDDSEEKLQGLPEHEPEEIPLLTRVKKGFMKIVVPPGEKARKEKVLKNLYNLENAAILFDEASITCNIKEDIVEALLKKKGASQKDLYICACAHGPGDLNKAFYRNLDKLYIWRVTEAFDMLTGRVQNPDNLAAAFEYVRTKAHSDPHFYEIYDLSEPKDFKNLLKDEKNGKNESSTKSRAKKGSPGRPRKARGSG